MRFYTSCQCISPRMHVYTHASLVASSLEVPSHWLLLSRHAIAGAGQAPALAWLLARPVTMQLRQRTPLFWRHCPCCTRDAACITTGVLSPTRWRVMATWPLVVWLVWRLCLCRHCTGVTAHNMLVSLPASHCHCHRHCTNVVPFATWASLPLLRWRCNSCRTRVAASIANRRLPSHDAAATRQCI
jgi:hypothetical protein